MNQDFIKASKIVGCVVVRSFCVDQDDILSIRFALVPETDRLFTRQIIRSSGRVFRLQHNVHHLFQVLLAVHCSRVLDKGNE